MNKFVLAAVAATMATAAHAVPIPDGGPGDIAGFSIGGEFSIDSAPLAAGDTLTINSVTSFIGATPYFDLINATPTGLVDIVLAAGASNSDETLTATYDPGGPAANVTGGTFTFNFGQSGPPTVNTGGSLIDFEIDGFLEVTDSQGVFDTTAGSWNFSGTIPVNGTSGTYSLSITVPPDPTAVVPVPAALPLLLTGIAGLGFLGWRRSRAEA